MFENQTKNLVMHLLHSNWQQSTTLLSLTQSNLSQSPCLALYWHEATTKKHLWGEAGRSRFKALATEKNTTFKEKSTLNVSLTYFPGPDAVDFRLHKYFLKLRILLGIPAFLACYLDSCRRRNLALILPKRGLKLSVSLLIQLSN